ncbi:hypothetical protein J6590_019478 [Homalodisca vitripennis]|nr:hypothetical protein J6590_019478 [Homalodisca vitripennis]
MSSSVVKVEETKPVNEKEVIPAKNVILKESGGWDTLGRLSTLKRNLKTLSAHTSRKPVDDIKGKGS